VAPSRPSRLPIRGSQQRNQNMRIIHLQPTPIIKTLILLLLLEPRWLFLYFWHKDPMKYLRIKNQISAANDY